MVIVRINDESLCQEIAELKRRSEEQRRLALRNPSLRERDVQIEEGEYHVGTVRTA
jgi:hypothetical protein